MDSRSKAERDDVSTWDQAHYWRKRGVNFLVEVYYSPGLCQRGDHRWALYLYLYPGHRHFKDAVAHDEMFKHKLPCDRGDWVTWDFHLKDGTQASVKFGTDYQHSWNEYEMQCPQEHMPGTVASDAVKLFDWAEVARCEAALKEDGDA